MFILVSHVFFWFLVFGFGFGFFLFLFVCWLVGALVFVSSSAQHVSRGKEGRKGEEDKGTKERDDAFKSGIKKKKNGVNKGHMQNMKIKHLHISRISKGSRPSCEQWLAHNTGSAKARCNFDSFR